MPTSMPILRDLAYRCETVYGRGPEVQHSRDVDWSVYPIGNDYALTFRGTTTRSDWVANLWRAPWHGVVSGFRLAWEDAEPDVVALLATIRGLFPDTRFWLTGHSQGAAIACVAAMYLPDSFDIAGVVTFACPGVVKRKLRAWDYTDCTTHVVSRFDPVTWATLTAVRPDGETIKLPIWGHAIAKYRKALDNVG